MTKNTTNTTKKSMKKFYDSLLRIFFPPRCIACGKEGASFCSACRGRIPVRENFSSAGIFSLWEYGHPSVRSALLSLKYKNKRTIAEDIAESLHDVLLEQLAEKSLFADPTARPDFHTAFVLVPIPLSAQRFKKRGYNQSELLAKELERKNPLSFILETSVLYKIQDTETQVSVKNRAKRLRNMRGSFAVQNQEKIVGKTILVIDDVVTTGATIEEARRMLLKAGAHRVYGVTIAH